MIKYSVNRIFIKLNIVFSTTPPKARRLKFSLKINNILNIDLIKVSKNVNPLGLNIEFENQFSYLVHFCFDY